MARGGWEVVVVPPAAKLVDLFPGVGEPWPAWEGKPPMVIQADRKKHRKMSANHHAVGVAARLLWAVAYGNEADYASAKEAALFWLNLELRTVGMWQGEQFTGAPHGGFHMLALFTAILAALYAKDGELLRELLDLLRRLYAYLAITADDNGEVICCGERMPKGPAAPQQSAIWRESQGMTHPDAKKIQKQLSSDFWASLRAYRACWGASPEFRHEMRADAASGKLPLTAQEVVVEKWRGGHRAFYGTVGGDRTCPWVWTHGGITFFPTEPDEAMPIPFREIEETFRSPNRNQRRRLT